MTNPRGIYNPHDIYEMEQRILNLEVALQTLWAFLEDTQSSRVQESVGAMMLELFENNGKMGGFRRAHIDIQGPYRGK